MEPSATPKEVFTDPVCLMNVFPGKSAYLYIYQKRTYYFCAQSCCDEFASNPARYLDAKPPKKKGIWGRYLERLNKVTGGKSMKCH